MYKLCFLFAGLFSSLMGWAQYGDANRAANEGAIRAAQSRELNNTLNQIRDNMNSKPVAPGGYGSTSKALDAETQALADFELRKRLGKLTAAEQAKLDSAAAVDKRQKQEQAKRQAENRQWEIDRYFGERNRHADQFYQKHKEGSALGVDDLYEIGYLEYLDAYNRKFQGSRYRSVFTCYDSIHTPAKFLAEVNYVGLDSSLATLRRCASYPSFALKQIRLLRPNYPNDQAKLDSAEIDIWPYYFGANRRYASVENEAYANAICQYQMGTPAKQEQSVKRVYALYQQYPEHTLRACGKARIGFHPFLLMAAMPLQSDERRFELYKLVLYTPTDHQLVTSSDDEAQYYVPASYYEPGTKYNTERIQAFIGNRSLYDAAVWLIKKRPDYLKSLSQAEWEKIANLQGLTANQIAWVFRGDSGKKYRKNYRALHQLIKEQEKQPGYKK